MAQQFKCSKCKTYTLKEVCPKCGEKAVSPAYKFIITYQEKKN